MPNDFLSACEIELRLLRSQLVDQARQIQRLLTVQRELAQVIDEQAVEVEKLQQQRAEQMLRITEQAAEIARLEALVVDVEAAASV